MKAYVLISFVMCVLSVAAINAQAAETDDMERYKEADPLKGGVIQQQIYRQTTHRLALKGIKSVLHGLYPNAEQDEAFYAYDHELMSKGDLNKLMEGSSEDYFNQMDSGLTLPANQENLQKTVSNYYPGISKGEAVRRIARGRNNWIVWTGGNDRFWNYMARATFGSVDFLKTISNIPAYGRENRWQILGLINEPCFKKASGPRTDRWGLLLDERIVSADCPKDPFADSTKYPGLKIGARGTVVDKKKNKVLEVGSFYGEPTGIVGLRLFTNPDFDEKAAKAWDPVKFYNDENYYNNPNLIRPYRVGMACAFCHVGPNPTRPPADANFNNLKWENLNSNVGAQYFWVDRILAWNFKKNEDNFVYQLLHTSRPGSLDTSLISSDQINNPRTMNAVYELPARLTLAKKMNHEERLKGPELDNNQFNFLPVNDLPPESVLRDWYSSSKKGSAGKGDTKTSLTMRVLKDGSDSVGALGALNRVYVNIGLFSEEWIQNFIPLIGGKFVTPFRIDVAEKRSHFWNATVNQTPDLALYFLAATKKDKLADAPGGAQYLKDFNGEIVNHGKEVFAQSCAGCHSSKLPEKAYSYFAADKNCTGEGYLNCWKAYAKYTYSEDFQKEMLVMVKQPDFLDQNFMSTDLRIPITVVESQLCSPVATNALKNNTWDNFSSNSYKKLPTVGEFLVSFPNGSLTKMTNESVKVPGGGRGYLRPPSLVSLWSTAPFLQNNTLGKFDYRGTVAGRMASFDDSIHRLLYPEKRGQAMKAKGEMTVEFKTSSGDTLNGIMDVTTADSYLIIPQGYLPKFIFTGLIKVVGAAKVSEFMEQGIAYRDVPSLPGQEMRSVASTADNNEPKKNWIQRIIASIAGDEEEAAPLIPDEVTANYSDVEKGKALKIGPIPAGVPVNLIANIDMSGSISTVIDAVVSMFHAVTALKANTKLSPEEKLKIFMDNAGAALLKASKCKDFVVNKGHYFGTEYARGNKGDRDAVTTPEGKAALAKDKEALIEYLKYF